MHGNEADLNFFTKHVLISLTWLNAMKFRARMFSSVEWPALQKVPRPLNRFEFSCYLLAYIIYLTTTFTLLFITRRYTSFISPLNFGYKWNITRRGTLKEDHLESELVEGTG